MFTPSKCALPLLCIVQGCERFSFLAVLPLFILYLHHHVGIGEHTALMLLGLFLALSYMASILGGAVADRWLGCAEATLLGCVLLGLGYGTLILDRRELLVPSLVLQAAGHGLFKPGISVATGSLYPSGDPRRESAFLTTHIATNIGCVAGPLCVAWAQSETGTAMFRWAAGGMAVATLITLLGYRCIRSVLKQHQDATPKNSLAASQESRLRAIYLICSIGLILWLTVQQTGTSLVLFAADHTRLELFLLKHRILLGPGHFASLHALLVLLLMPLTELGRACLRRRGHEPSTFAKMVWGYVLTAAAFVVLVEASRHGGDIGRVSPGWLAGCYLLLSAAELFLSPMGLSLVTQLAPPQHSSRMVGLWFASTGVGNALAGVLGLLWDRWPNHRYFALLALLSIGAAMALFSRLSQLEPLIASPRDEARA
jgi:POT family proton-dependent oligopeptide transporter